MACFCIAPIIANWLLRVELVPGTDLRRSVIINRYQSFINEIVMAIKLAVTKFKIKFDGKNNFFLWQVKIRDLLIQQDLHVALEKRDRLPCQLKNGGSSI